MDNKINLPARILWINDTIQSDSYCVKAHAHGSYYHLTYIESGSCSLMLNNRHYTLTAGNAAIAAPDDTHCIESVPAGTAIRLWEIKFIVTSQTIRSALLAEDIFFEADPYERALLGEIIALSHDATSNVNAISFAFSSFLYHFAAKRSTQHTQQESRYLTGIDTSGFSKATVETVKYIEKNYMHEISLEDIGSAIGYNKNYVSTMVKHDLSINVNDLISFIRVREAAEKLYYSDESITGIYQQCSFKTLSHFTRVFKKYVGVPPAQYRRSYPDNIFDGSSSGDRSPRAIPLWAKCTLKDYIEGLSHY